MTGPCGSPRISSISSPQPPQRPASLRPHLHLLHPGLQGRRPAHRCQRPLPPTDRPPLRQLLYKILPGRLPFRISSIRSFPSSRNSSVVRICSSGFSRWLLRSLRLLASPARQGLLSSPGMQIYREDLKRCLAGHCPQKETRPGFIWGGSCCLYMLHRPFKMSACFSFHALLHISHVQPCF